jgi:hypothetical protein
MDALIQQRIEHFNGTTGFLKHFTTLSTGSILLIMSFSNKLLLPSSYSWMIITAIIGFVFSIVSSTFIYIMTIFYASPLTIYQRHSDTVEKILAVSLLLSWLSFLVAIISLSIGMVFSI